MEERKFKIRGDLIITTRPEKGKTLYCVLNPLTGESRSFSQKTYAVLRHFNGRTVKETQGHLSDKHRLNLTRKALEGYRDLFLGLYLFEDCGDLYLQRIERGEKESLCGELKLWAEESAGQSGQDLPLVEELVFNQALQALEEGDALKAVDYFKDLKNLNPQGKISAQFFDKLEEILVKMKKEKCLKKDQGLPALKPAVVGVGVLLVTVILGQRFFFNPPSFSQHREQSLRVIKAVSEELLQGKSLALNRGKP